MWVRALETNRASCVYEIPRKNFKGPFKHLGILSDFIGFPHPRFVSHVFLPYLVIKNKTKKK